jgi:hypothetical protein
MQVSHLSLARLQILLEFQKFGLLALPRRLGSAAVLGTAFLGFLLIRVAALRIDVVAGSHAAPAALEWGRAAGVLLAV